MAMPNPTRDNTFTLKHNLKNQKWLSLIGMPVLLASTFLGVYSFWGVMFVYWGVMSLRSGEVFLLEPIDREKDPALFWIISAMWIGFGLLYILTDFYPRVWL